MAKKIAGIANPHFGHDMYVWVVADTTGKHGIPATVPLVIENDLGGIYTGMSPMVATRKKTALSMEPMAGQVARMLNLKVQLVHLRAVEVIREVEP
jgi:hypothetical protein